MHKNNTEGRYQKSNFQVTLRRTLSCLMPFVLRKLTGIFLRCAFTSSVKISFARTAHGIVLNALVMFTVASSDR